MEVIFMSKSNKYNSFATKRPVAKQARRKARAHQTAAIARWAAGKTETIEHTAAVK
ncbi:hypothetical protein FC34_GL000433 [Lacticaseibacillus brantae DSM 23927]|uniref:Uncharacterized protein n=2 Tax=Lacticaseibacillus brantae TaxID=943673 RepID=A0A0R2BAS9_9LACO|nr:hypothetical protein FC34_GL000433 [Lacticaseibacillus brantae DSM 23927]